MRRIYGLFIIIFGLQISQTKIFNGCRFVETFYNTHRNLFQLNQEQTLLTVRPLYDLSNQSLSIGIIYRLAETYLVPVPLLFQCPQSERIYAPNDCEFCNFSFYYSFLFM